MIILRGIRNFSKNLGMYLFMVDWGVKFAISFDIWASYIFFWISHFYRDSVAKALELDGRKLGGRELRVSKMVKKKKVIEWKTERV